MAHNGIPFDLDLYAVLTTRWDEIRGRLIQRIDAQYQCYEGTSYRQERFRTFLQRHNIPWPHHPSGYMQLDSDTFKEMSRTYPIIRPLHELRETTSQLKKNELAVGSDGRHRGPVFPFGTATGRNNPSTTRFVFGPATWIRSLIRPTRGTVVAYCDYSQQEFAIGAVFSGDRNMISAYESGGAYSAFAQQATGQTPTREVRDLYKVCALATNYGAGVGRLALQLNIDLAQARQLAREHHDTYRDFHTFTQGAADFAQFAGWIDSRFGWRLHVGSHTKAGTLKNFPMQAGAADMLRLACGFAIDAGVSVCAPVHDALLVIAPEADAEEAIATAVKAMVDASRIVLDGFPLRVDVKTVRYPQRFSDPRGAAMWRAVTEILTELGMGDLYRREAPPAPP